MKQFCILLFLTLISFTSCKSIDKMYQQGNDTKVIEQVLKRETKHKASTQEIKLLEQSFNNLKNETAENIKRYKASNSDKKWEDVFNSFDKIDRVQRLIERHKPIRSKNGYEPNFTFIEINEQKAAAGKQAAKYYIDEADFLYKIAMKNPDDYEAARNAYYTYRKIERFDPTIDVTDAMRRMKEYGTIVIGTRVEHSVRYNRNRRRYGSQPRYSNSIARKLERMIDFSSNEWVEQKKYFTPNEVDYIITVALVNTDIRYVGERNSTKNYSKEIEVPTTRKDSLGNPIKAYKIVNARVSKTEETKKVEATIELAIENTQNYYEAFNRVFYGYDEDEENICQISGDERAIPNSEKCNRSSYSFDSDENMLEDAIDDIKYDLKQDINRFIQQKK